MGPKNAVTKDWRNGIPPVVAIDDDSTAANQLDKISSFCFPDIPVHFPLKKKLMIAKTTTLTGLTWENLQLFLTFAICFLIILDAYFYDSYEAMRSIYNLEIAITQIFVVDFALQTYLRSDPWGVLVDMGGLLDVLTILPTFIALIFQQDMTDGPFFILYCCRLLRSVRLFKVLRKLSGKNKHIAMFALILSCASFFVTGCFYYLENMEYRLRSGCNHINSATSYEPSCSMNSLVTETDDGCDCAHCYAYYQQHDSAGHPGQVRCNTRSFFEAIYFTMITGTAIGYGDASAVYTTSRVVVLFFIIATLIVVPIQINTMLTFMTTLSPFRAPYAGNQDCHIIICGFVNDKRKLEKFFKEFFHPDRLLTSTDEYHAVILGLGEPSEEVRNLLVSPMLDSRVTYVIGSALSVEDLKRARADTAAGMFFLCNTEVHPSSVQHEDAATVLRSLSVANFSPDLRSLVQILRPEEKAILKDSDVDVILCLDEFKTALIARNAICPGFSTFIENIFHSFGNVSTELENSMDPWYGEYLHGARKEIYYSLLPEEFLYAMNYNFQNIVQAVYMEFGIMVIGLCDIETQDIILNPTAKDIGPPSPGKTGFGSPGKREHVPNLSFQQFFRTHNVAVVLADDQLESDNLMRSLADRDQIAQIIDKMEAAERSFKTKHFVEKEKPAAGASKNKLKFIARNIVAPIKRTAVSAKMKATRRFSKHGKKNSTKVFAGGEDIELPFLKRVETINAGTEGDTDSSDDEKEEGYIGFKIVRANSELPMVIDSTRSMFAKAVSAKRPGSRQNDDRPVTSEATSNNRASGPPSDGDKAAVRVPRGQKIAEAVPTISTQASVIDATAIAEEKCEQADVGVSISSKVGKTSVAAKLSGNQQRDLLTRTVSNDQVMKAIKRKSEPPLDKSGEKEKPSSVKRKSAPTPSSRPSSRKLIDEDALMDSPISSPLRNKPGEGGSCHSGSSGTGVDIIRGPPLSMANPQSPALSGYFHMPAMSSFAEETVMLDHNGETSGKYYSSKMSGKLKPLSNKESIEKLNARKSAKMKKIKQQVRQNVVVIKSNDSVPRRSKKPSGNSVKKFDRYDSDLLKVLSKDTVPDENNCGIFDGELSITPTYRDNMNCVATSAAVSLGQASDPPADAPAAPDTLSGAFHYSGLESFESMPSIKSPVSQITEPDFDESRSPPVSDKKGLEPVSSQLAAGNERRSSFKALSTKSLSARNKKMGNIVGTLMTITKNIKKWHDVFGKPSAEITNADNLKHHIILFGADSSALLLFISELRRPAIRRLDYHPIVIVGREKPANWDIIADRYNDIYYLKGYLTKTSTFRSLNIDLAFSIVLFSFNETQVKKPATNAHLAAHTPDADALFMYLKLQQYIPDHVFFFVELRSASNISVLNATMMRRMREHSSEDPAEFNSSEKNMGITKRPTDVYQIPALMPPLLSSLSSRYFGATNEMSGASSSSADMSVSMKQKSLNRKMNILENKRSERLFWDAMDTHHILPVFASGKVYVPETFESLMVQSFYNSMTPIICDKLVCGQKGQAVMQAKLPSTVVGWTFMQLFRMWSQFQVVIFGLFRAPSKSMRALLPYVYVCPPANAKIREGDAVMVYARNAQLLKALSASENIKNPKL